MSTTNTIDNGVLCPYPWRSIAVRPSGVVVPCCRYPHIPNTGEAYLYDEEPRNAPHWIELRQKMLDGIPSEGCQTCYDDDANGKESMRSWNLKQFFPIKNEIISLETVEVNFSNLCNLACVSCYRYLSTKWWTEDVKAGRVEKIGILENDFDNKDWDFSKVNIVKFAGGEPLMEQKKTINFLKKLNLSQVTVELCTNGTMYPCDELVDLLKKCKSFRLYLSMDGIKSVNEWYRWPTKHEDVIENMKRYEETFLPLHSYEFSPQVHCVLNAYNVMYIQEFVEFMRDNFDNWSIDWDWIRTPSWQQINVLPKQIKQPLIKSFTNLSKKHLEREQGEPWVKRPDPYLITIKHLEEDPAVDWEIFKEKTLDLAAERDLPVLDMITKISNVWDL